MAEAKKFVPGKGMVPAGKAVPEKAARKKLFPPRKVQFLPRKEKFPPRRELFQPKRLCLLRKNKLNFLRGQSSPFHLI